MGTGAMCWQHLQWPAARSSHQHSPGRTMAAENRVPLLKPQSREKMGKPNIVLPEQNRVGKAGRTGRATAQQPPIQQLYPSLQPSLHHAQPQTCSSHPVVSCARWVLLQGSQLSIFLKSE